METVRTQDVGVNDLNWKIQYDPERCTLCGSCVAACTFGAIEAAVERRSSVVSRGPVPNPVKEHAAMLLAWIGKHDSTFAHELSDFLGGNGKGGDILGTEK